MSELSDAYTELLDTKKEATGKREYILLDGRKIEGLISEIRAGEVLIGGGIAQSDGFECQILQSKVAEKPSKNTPIECRGQNLFVMDANDVNGVTWTVIAGDPSSEDR